ncbi:MAG TPA: DNA alkylation repair protein [Streptosporangiaceae bacterium]|nr:DNA alkylation repair protein [Streptosporangiaceae bacterium]
MKSNSDALHIESILRGLGRPERAVSEQNYLKSDLEFAGVAVPVMRSAVATWTRECGGLDHDRLTALVRALWEGPLFECRAVATILLERNTKLLGPADTELIEYLLRRCGTWALVDPIATNVAGVLAEKHDLTATLDRWAADSDFWIRRSALLTLLRPLRRLTPAVRSPDDSPETALRRGEGDFERFAGYADTMLEEKEFFIRKAIGWVLREVSKKRPELVATWLAPRIHRASGVTVREAVKYLPDADRDLLLAGYKARQPVIFRLVKDA